MKTLILIIAVFISSIAFSQYYITKPPGNQPIYFDISTTGAILNLDDDEEMNIISPFTIYLGKVGSTNLRVSNNGVILFDTTIGDVAAFNDNLTTDLPRFAPFWDNFDSEVGNVYFQTFGTAPNRRFVIQWVRVHFDGSTNIDPADFEVVFSESSKTIQFMYADADMDGTEWDEAKSATIGISTLSEVNQYSFNMSGGINSNSQTTIEFVPRQTYVPDKNFEAYLEANSMGNGISDDNYVYTYNIQGVLILSIASKDIADLTGIEDFTALTELYCDNNYSLNSIDISNNTALTKLACFYDSLTHLDVSNNTALKQLECQGNQFTSLDLSANSALTTLYCHDNKLTGLNLSANPALVELICETNSITSLDLSANHNLKYLYCATNKLNNLDLSANIALQDLSCARNPITGLDLSFNLLLYDLRCSFTQLTSLDLSSNTYLTNLYCSNTQLSFLDLSEHSSLVYFHCFNSQLTGLNIANGNNSNVKEMWAHGNSNLNCIQVDNVDNTPPAGQDWRKDAIANYSNDCSFSGVNQISFTGAIYPNPVTDILFVESQENIIFYKIYTTQGQLVKAGQIVNNKINVSSLSQGIYIFKVFNSKAIDTRVIVKQ